jgi:hypothetical protein
MNSRRMSQSAHQRQQKVIQFPSVEAPISLVELTPARGLRMKRNSASLAPARKQAPWTS